MRSQSPIQRPTASGGYAFGYAVIAASLSLALLLTLPLAAAPMTRVLGVLGMTVLGQ